MAKYVFVLCLVLSAAVAEISDPRSSKQYRSDYVYNRQTDAFYKLHIVSRRRWTLDDVCRTEGASLMSPFSEQDIVQVHSMFKNYPDLGEYVWVADDGQAHESAEEEPLIDLNTSADRGQPAGSSQCVVVNRQGDVETMPCYRQLPFVCKVSANDAPYDPHCGVYSNNYKYYQSVRSCYTIPRVAYTWSGAYTECEMEGAHLLVLNSETEREIIHNLTNTEQSVRGTQASWFFFAGFRAEERKPNERRVFKTIFNQTLEQAGFAQWAEGEPNNALGREDCGTVFKNDGKLNDVDCTHEYAFICESDVRST